MREPMGHCKEIKVYNKETMKFKTEISDMPFPRTFFLWLNWSHYSLLSSKESFPNHHTQINSLLLFLIMAHNLFPAWQHIMD